MHMIRQKSPAKTQSTEELLHLVHTGALEHEIEVCGEAVLPGWLGGTTWAERSEHTEAPWLEIIPGAEPGIPAEAHTLFVVESMTNRREQYWETVVFCTLGVSSAAGVAIAFWVLTHIAQ
jgi:hypothetical protein